MTWYIPPQPHFSFRHVEGGQAWGRPPFIDWTQTLSHTPGPMLDGIHPFTPDFFIYRPTSDGEYEVTVAFGGAVPAMPMATLRCILR